MVEMEGVTRGFAPGTSVPLAALYDAEIRLDQDQRAMRTAILQLSSKELAALLDKWNVEQKSEISGDELAMVLNKGVGAAKPKKSKSADQAAIMVVVEPTDEDMEEAE